ncbi:sugar ABC transporter ATP-binding protein [Nocardioides sp. LHD-245]|uniref:sugar ABC transporter ATP-binding protein n=1 Tax=Nocardioides sp. LHD-245 TaxID=3051387 RepID=UPI0027E005CE|nr:sugar ABC transporter ATP-binding protein [Nocardioides sp. LHD-245]
MTDRPPARATPTLQMRGIVKSYGGATALRGVDFVARAGRIHALLGMNGAGKSTLVQILSGAVAADSGVIEVDGAPLTHQGPRAARAAGIATVYQRRTLVPALSVAENLMLGRLPRRRRVVAWRDVHDRAASMLADLDLDLDPQTAVDTLGPGSPTLVEIARESHRGGRILILDEPTASLGGHDAALIHRLVRQLAEGGTSVVYISHHLDEVIDLSDDVTILRDGHVVLTAETASTSAAEIVSAMVGTTVVNERPPRPARAHTPVLRIEGLAKPGRIADLSVTVGAGEIVAVIGPAGDGHEELFPFLSGMRSGYDGKVSLRDEQIRPRRIRSSLRSGLRCVTGDRLGTGLVPQLSVDENVTALHPRARRPLMRWRQLRAAAGEARARFGVVTLQPNPPVAALSGGNQQKALLAKWLSGTAVSACLLEDPTGGVDVRAKAEIHTIIESLAESGIAVLLTSSDTDEVMRLADRVVVVRAGRAIAERRVDDLTHDALTHLLLGGSQ